MLGSEGGSRKGCYPVTAGEEKNKTENKCLETMHHVCSRATQIFHVLVLWHQPLYPHASHSLMSELALRPGTVSWDTDL